jgi:hypothetical protein
MKFKPEIIPKKSVEPRNTPVCGANTKGRWLPFPEGSAQYIVLQVFE